MDVNDLKGLFAEVNKRMDLALERVKHDLAAVRTGRASTALLDHVHVEAYGSKVPLNQVAGLSIPEPTLIVVQPFDPTLVAAVERAIRVPISFDRQTTAIFAGPDTVHTDERRKELPSRHKLAERTQYRARGA